MNKIFSITFCFKLLLPIITFAQKYERTILLDSIFAIAVKGDSADLGRFQLLVQYENFKKDTNSYKYNIIDNKKIITDTLLNNLDKPYSMPMHLEYVGVYNFQFICFIVKTEDAYSYVVYKRDERFKFIFREILDWRDYRFSTTFKVHDCFHIEMRNGYGDFMWTIDPDAKKFIKSEIKSEKH